MGVDRASRAARPTTESTAARGASAVTPRGALRGRSSLPVDDDHSASSPRRSFKRPHGIRSDDRGQRLVANPQANLRQSPSIRTSSMNPCSRFLALSPSSGSSASEVSVRRRPSNLVRERTVISLSGCDGVHLPCEWSGRVRCEPSLQGRIRDAELLSRRPHGQERHSTPFWSKSLRINMP